MVILIDRSSSCLAQQLRLKLVASRILFFPSFVPSCSSISVRFTNPILGSSQPCILTIRPIGPTTAAPK
ncbi:unnamed protein product [Protopolystoma xenopodis]|uniref:Uncharacterized protein n=1 Tax=Protopolystoma xenopodis TaxID=117903 RepID=A0A3S5A3K1_9PLAT|nr:unnamed protein product [Protopolystoma xenopodis]